MRSGCGRWWRVGYVLAVAAGWFAMGAPASAAGGVRASFDPVSLVDPFVGTDGNGHTFPGADVPFGMVQFSPVSVGGGPGGYQYSESRLRGFSVTRLSGPGCTNFGDLPLMPSLSAPSSSPAADPAAFTARYSHRDEAAQPGFYQVRLASGVSVALTATTHTGLGVFTYPTTTKQGTMLINPSGSANPRAATVRVVGRKEVVGAATSATFGGACGHPRGSYRLYYAIVFERPFARFGVWSGERLAIGGRARAGSKVGAFVSFDTGGGEPVRAKIGVSYVSVGNALGNLASEATSWNYQTIRARAQTQWRELLKRVHVAGGSRPNKQVFYTALYHAFLFPSVFSDSNGEYRGGDGEIHNADGHTRYTNFSGWDIYRCEMQLLAWLAPSKASDMIQSIVADGQETGQLPKWPVAGAETGLMVGDPSDAIIADGYAFGARSFDRGLALREMLHGAEPNEPPSGSPAAHGYLERPALAAYLSLGYTPAAAATTLEYAVADFAIAEFASALGDQTDSQTMLGRSGSWRQLFNPATGFLEPRVANGSFPANFDPTLTRGFVEGNAWQYTWMAPHDMAGLLGTIGAPTALQRLNSFFAKLNAGPNAPHAWLGNEPSFDSPYAYLWLALPARSEAVVRRALTTLFTPTPDGLPGNDDLGATSSWYVWNALGLYPAIPGIAGLAVLSPLFPHAAINLANGTRLQIDATNTSATNRYIQTVTLAGQPIGTSWQPLTNLANGGKLTITLGPSPSAWATGANSGPPSFEPTGR